MKHYITIDSGGSKIFAVLFNESFDVVATSIAGGGNTTSRKAQEVQKNIAQCIKSLLEGTGVCEVALLTGTVENPLYQKEVLKYASCGGVLPLSEGHLGLYARGVFTDGFCVVSGTGSDVFYIKDHKMADIVGGWGYLLGDDGSGYDIGRSVLRSVFFAEEQRGEATALTELVKRRYHCTAARDILSQIYQKPSVAAEVAALSPLCQRAANAGDRVAIDIFKVCGTKLARQACDMLQKHQPASGTPICLCGGTFKAHKSVSQSFRNYVEAMFPGYPILEPVLEPAAGGICNVFYRQHGQMSEKDYELLCGRLACLAITKNKKEKISNVN